MKLATTVNTNIDFERDGKQIGFVNLPLSIHEDAWGVVPIPMTVIKNGRGPTVILQGGNHGDEYEGPIALGELIRDLDPSTISGRLVIVPAVNLPAVVAGRRTSPVDGLNLNRLFPGDHLGTTTPQIAAYINDVLFPMADAFIDLHSGGSSAVNVPSAIIEPASDHAHLKRNIDAVVSFGAPMVVVISNRGDPRTSTAAAVRAGLTVVGTELAGGGTVSMDALAMCRRGIRNVLGHLGVLPTADAKPSLKRPPMYEVVAPKAYVLASETGVFEPFHANGAEVSAGQPAGRIHFLANPGRAPVTLHYESNGILYARRQPGQVRPGNLCLVVVSPYQDPSA
jgi:N-alpha-acetyl-L-2,4-diaminobutyrate deacetylase